MYLAHFGLDELPFGLTPDTAFAVPTRSHQEALNTLLVAAGAGEGFIKITGEVGTGKTLLCRRFLAALPDEWVSCYLPNPQHTPRSLLMALADELGASQPASADEYTLLKNVNGVLLQRAREGRRVVVCIDEAQAMKPASLEMLRLLSNLETEKQKLMQLVLFGQPELDERLARHDLRQLRQRIAFHYRMEALSRDELRSYLDHRLRVAGFGGHRLFSRAAIASMHRRSLGTPRLINVLAHKALLALYGEGGSLVCRRHVVQADRDTSPRAGAFFSWLGCLLP